jgi:hypothetical protein
MLSNLVQDKAQLELCGQAVACGLKQRVLRLCELQKETRVSKKQFPKVMAFLWDMDVEDVESCMDFGHCMYNAIQWVQELEPVLIENSSERFYIELQVCSKIWSPAAADGRQGLLPVSLLCGLFPGSVHLNAADSFQYTCVAEIWICSTASSLSTGEH